MFGVRVRLYPKLVV